jgi:hypothetical protein
LLSNLNCMPASRIYSPRDEIRIDQGSDICGLGPAASRAFRRCKARAAGMTNAYT